jgi:hypothetical protein
MNIHTTNTVSDWVFSKLKKKLNAKKCKTSLGARKPNWINNISKNVWGHLPMRERRLDLIILNSMHLILE